MYDSIDSVQPGVAGDGETAGAGTGLEWGEDRGQEVRRRRIEG